MSGDAHIARRIAAADEDPAVKKCLSALFTHELSNADKGMPAYKADYEKSISKFAKSWNQGSTGEVNE